MVRVPSKLTNDFFSKSQHLNFESRLSIWLTMGLVGKVWYRGTGVRRRQSPIEDLFL
jgi:hypothetical protein